MRRVVVTGMGIVAPTGIGVLPFWGAVTEARPALCAITRFDAASYPCRIGGEVTDRSYEQLLDPKKLRTATHVTRMALAAAALACTDARLDGHSSATDGLGVCLGTALGGWREAEQQHGILLDRGARRVNPFVTNGSPSLAPGAEVAAAMGATGAQFTFATSCAASLQAIAHAAALIADGELEACLAGGTESPLFPTVIAGMSRTQELSTADDPARASRPFDQAHAGLVPSEGSCVLVLESADGAARRGVDAYGAILGGSSSCDAQGLYSFDLTNAPAAHAIHRLLHQIGLGVTDIDYVCAHANASPAFDRKEIRVLKKAFGEHAARLPVSSIKGVIGHPFGAAGAFQVAATLLAIRHQLLPPTCNLETPDPECDLDCVPGAARPALVRRALVTSYGYGGINAYLAVAQP